MTREATQAPAARPPRGGAAIAEVAARARSSPAVRDALRAFAWSRLAIVAVAVFAALSSGAADGRNAAVFDKPAVTAPLGGGADVLLTPLAHWDAVWYLTVANHGYAGADSPRHAFFPLYPLLARGLGAIGGGGAGAVLLAAYAIALLAFLAALVLLHRLTEIELGRRAAWPAVLLLCVFPVSFYFGAPYSESLFLLASIAAFYAARTERWALAGLAAAAASGTRSAGLLLIVPLLIIYLHGPRGPGAESRSGRRPRYPVHLDVLWLALAPIGLAAFAAYLGVAYGDPLSFSHVQEFWNRSFAGPFVGAWDGTVAAFDGVRQLASGSRETVYFTQAGGDPLRVAGQNVTLFCFLCFALVGTAGVLRRLPLAYGLYVGLALALPLSYPVDPQPLMSLPRFVAVLFPLFMWLGAACERRGSTERFAIGSAVLLGLFVTQFASWQWVA
jgi:Mannosyltransferase (PIG-V)